MSMGGLGLRMATPVSPGEFIRIRVQLPTDRGPAWFDPDAVVSRVTRGSGADTVGVCFVSPSAKLSALLEARTRDHLVGRSPRRAPRKVKDNAEHDLAVLFRSAVEDVSSGFEP